MNSATRRRSFSARLPIFCAVVSTTLLTTFAPRMVNAQPTDSTAASTTAAIDPDAKVILEQIASAEYGLSSYSATFTIRMPDARYPFHAHGSLTYVRPDNVIAHTDRNNAPETILSDGKNMIEVADGAKKYSRDPASTGDQGIFDVILRSGASRSITLAILATWLKGVKTFLRPGISIRRAPDETLDGVVVDVLEFTGGQTKEDRLHFTIAAGKQDHLLRRVVTTEGGLLAPSVGTELYTDVRANPILPASRFLFTPKPGIRKTTSSVPPLFDVRVKVGAVPFAFTGIDMQGGKHNLRAYKGKVLLLDFWATSFIMDPDHIPSIVAAYDKYHARGFEVLGIDMDDAKDRGKLLGFLQDNRMAWPEIFEGKGWEGKIPHIYHLHAPRLWMLIGKDGKIVAVDPDDENIGPTVKKALAK